MTFSFMQLKKPAVVGILNVTPDSFYDGGRYALPDTALRRACEMVNEGADMIDVGAVSTRPGSLFADEQTERERLLPALRLIIKEVNIPVSADTFRPEIARAALDCGVSVINDVSGYFNRDTAAAVKEYSAGWILMHTGGRGVGAGEKVKYENGVVASVQSFFDMITEKVFDFGFTGENICLDPGFGFSKDCGENMELLASLDKLDTHSCVLMCALSRKRFIKEFAHINGIEDILEGTVLANRLAFERGASLFRVHDVAENINMFNNITNIKKGSGVPDTVREK